MIKQRPDRGTTGIVVVAAIAASDAAFPPTHESFARESAMPLWAISGTFCSAKVMSALPESSTFEDIEP